MNTETVTLSGGPLNGKTRQVPKLQDILSIPIKAKPHWQFSYYVRAKKPATFKHVRTETWNRNPQSP